MNDGVNWPDVEELFALVGLNGRTGDKLRRAFENSQVVCYAYASSRIVGVTPAVHLPVFNRDALRGELYGRQAQLDSSVGQYNQTLLDAVREVADVVTNWRALERETLEQQTALDAAQSSYDLTSQRYRAGLDNYLSVLSSQNQVLLTQTLRAELQARRLSYSVDLVRALGGGYVAPAG